MSAPGHDIKRGRLSDDENAAIEALAGRNLKAGQIALRLNRHPATINHAMHRMGLKILTERGAVTFTRKGGSTVNGFSPDEDALIEEMRAGGASPGKIAAECLARFGRKRSPQTINTRLIMLANREEARCA